MQQKHKLLVNIGVALGIIMIFVLGFGSALFLKAGKNNEHKADSTTKSEWTAKMLDYGLYKKDSKAGTAESITPSGRAIVVYGQSLLERTTEVPGRLGTMFGFSYSVEGPDLSSQTTLKIIPPKPLTDSDGKTTSIFEYLRDSIVGVSNFNIWLFEHEWEIAEGTWTLELWMGDRKVLSKEFLVKFPKRL